MSEPPSLTRCLRLDLSPILQSPCLRTQDSMEAEKDIRVVAPSTLPLKAMVEVGLVLPGLVPGLWGLMPLCFSGIYLTHTWVVGLRGLGSGYAKFGVPSAPSACAGLGLAGSRIR